MDKTMHNGDLYPDEILRRQTPETPDLYFVFWQRTMNWGSYLIWAKDEKDACMFSTEFVLHTVVKVSRLTLPVLYGKQD